MSLFTSLAAFSFPPSASCAVSCFTAQLNWSKTEGRGAVLGMLPSCKEDREERMFNVCCDVSFIQDHGLLLILLSVSCSNV